MDQLPYQAILRLFAIAANYWYEIDGACARSGLDPATLPPRRFLTLVYYWAIERVATRGDAELEAWKAALYKPLPGRNPDRVSRDTIAEEMAMFDAL